jgi:hypothetical protein
MGLRELAREMANCARSNKAVRPAAGVLATGRRHATMGNWDRSAAPSYVDSEAEERKRRRQRRGEVAQEFRDMRPFSDR